MKFGEAKDVPKGQNKQGVVSIQGPITFLNDEGEMDQEIDIAKDLISMSKQQAMSKTMKKW